MLHRLLGFPGVVVLIQIDYDHMGPFLGKVDRNGTANAAVGTGNQGQLYPAICRYPCNSGHRTWAGAPFRFLKPGCGPEIELESGLG